MGSGRPRSRNESSARGELMTMRRAVVGLTAVILAATAGTLPASAGAPNYECRAGGYSFGIDQHRRAGLARVSGGAVRSASFVTTDQDGSTLDLTAEVEGRRWNLAIRGTGRSMTLRVSGRTIAGACAFVPGDHALGHVTAPFLLLRSTPADDAVPVARLRQRSLVWSSGRLDEQSGQVLGTPEWTRFRAVLRVRGGAASGGPQRLGMGATAGLDGASTIVEGWGRLADVSMLGPPGP